jgi:hypothetical protein
VTIRFATVVRVEGDKVKEEWMFANSMALAMQVGLMSHDEHGEKGEKAEPGEKGEKGEKAEKPAKGEKKPAEKK